MTTDAGVSSTTTLEASMHLHHPTTHTGRPETSKHTGGWLLAILLVAQLMVILDITAVNIAMPSIAKDLSISGTDISWTITSYSLIFGSLLLLGGRAADLLGRRRVFLTGLGVFTVSSLLSALAGSGAALFSARAGQGLGASMLSPAALSIITTAFTVSSAPRRWRRGAQSAAPAPRSAFCSAASSPSWLTGG
jgi:MFS family permease